MNSFTYASSSAGAGAPSLPAGTIIAADGSIASPPSASLPVRGKAYYIRVVRDDHPQTPRHLRIGRFYSFQYWAIEFAGFVPSRAIGPLQPQAMAQDANSLDWSKAIDVSGNHPTIVRDSNGRPVPELDGNGKPAIDRNGRPIYQLAGGGRCWNSRHLVRICPREMKMILDGTSRMAQCVRPPPGTPMYDQEGLHFGS